MKRRRNNPDLLILANPISTGAWAGLLGGGSRAKAPAVAPAAWAKFHGSAPDEADWINIPDQEGLPGKVWALGFLNGGTWENSSGGEGEVSFRTSRKNGPWLVSAPSDAKALWIVARNAIQLKRLERFVGYPMIDIRYTPSETSGKFDPDRGYIHVWGEGGKLPKSRWDEAQPVIERVTSTAYEIVAPVRNGFVIEVKGIVG